jgi:hypothetical protein
MKAMLHKDLGEENPITWDTFNFFFLSTISRRLSRKIKHENLQI